MSSGGKPRAKQHSGTLFLSTIEAAIVIFCRPSQRLGALGLLAVLAAIGPRAGATGVPIDGFLPMVGITLTDEFVDDIDFFSYPSTELGGSPIGPTSTQRYDVALLDTGAATSLLTKAADTAFKIAGPYSGQPDGFRGTESITIGGATGFLQASIGDPLGLYAAGLQTRTGAGASLAMNDSAFLGQTNTSLVTLPAESDLPNILGLSFASQYATRIRNSQPQVFELEGRTIRTPAIDFLPLGSGNLHGISRKAPMSLQGSSPSTPILFPNIENFDLNRPYENPSSPTVVQGGHFLNVNAVNNGTTLSNQQFFFDTGASVSVLSELTALQIGIDVQLDKPDFTVQIVGSGGVSEAVPGYYIDQFTVLATGGSVVLNNMPVLVLDVTNPASPGNVVPGIVGTNAFAGRDIIIDPNPSLGGGGPSAGVYISDSVIATRSWTSAAASASWSTAGNWSGAAAPTLTAIANVRHVAGGHQQVVVADARTASEVNVSGASAAQTMTLRVANGAKLTVFSGIHVEPFGAVVLQDGATLDAQYVQMDGNSTLAGTGRIRTGSGLIVGQVENNGGRVTVGDANGVGELKIDGRYVNRDDSTLAFTLGGVEAIAAHGLLSITDTAAFDGTLQVSLKANYAPTAGDSFTLATYESAAGQFANLMLPAGFGWNLDYGDTALVLNVTSVSVPGDLDNNGLVNFADLSAFKAGFGLPVGYGGEDILIWQRNLHGPGFAAVPEPAAVALALTGVVALAAHRRRPTLSPTA